MADIQALTSDVNNLQTNVDWWNLWVVRLIIAIAIAGLLSLITASAYAVFSWFALHKSRQLNAAQTALAVAEKTKLESDLKDKDVLISQANGKAEAANERSRALEMQTEELRSQNLAHEERLKEQAGQVAILQKSAADAITGQRRVEAELEKQKQETANMQIEAARAQKTVLELQERIKPRSVDSVQRTRFLEEVKDFPKGTIRILTIGEDPEASEFAKQLDVLFTEAGWKTQFTGMTVMVPPAFGIVIVVPSTGTGLPDSPMYHTARLIKALEGMGYKLDVQVNPALDPLVVGVIVGHKPLH